MTDLVPFLKSRIRDVPDFPKPGIIFKDITPLLNDGEAFRRVVDHFCERYRTKSITKIVGIESRGFIFGAAVAAQLSLGLSLIRKPGKLPYKTMKEEYSLEYGTDRVEIHVDSLSNRDRVVVVDDLIATGGTAAATGRLIERLGAHIHEFAFVSELEFLRGTELLKPHACYSLLKF